MRRSPGPQSSLRTNRTRTHKRLGHSFVIGQPPGQGSLQRARGVNSTPEEAVQARTMAATRRSTSQVAVCGDHSCGCVARTLRSASSSRMSDHRSTAT